MTLADKPAFPAPEFAIQPGVDQEKIMQIEKTRGMTLREYYAGLAMGELVGKGGCMGSLVDGVVVKTYADATAEEAIKYADALIKKLEE